VIAPVEPRSTRRELAQRGLAATASVAALTAVGACSAAAAAATPQSDAGVLGRVLAVEDLVVVAYRQALRSGALRPRVGRQVREILAQELEHVATLQRELERIGAPVPAAPHDLATAQRALAGHHMHTSLEALRTQNDCLKLLIDVESVAEGAYFAAIGALTDPALLRTSAGIMGCEAQHWTVLSAARHNGDVTFSVPYPFVEGST
jgi:hypothetical protein